MKKMLGVLVLIGLLGVQAQALVLPLYVDADGGTAGNTTWWTTDGAIDGLWRLRTGFGNNDSFALGSPGNEIFEASGTYGGEDVVSTCTIISGLTPGDTYGISVVYWSSHDNVNNQNWAIRAGFSLSSMLYFDRLGLGGATAGTPTGKMESDRDELMGYLGTAVANASGKILVFIDDKPGTSYIDRSWYDGLYVVPEPTTLVLLAIGGLCLRRRKA